MTSRLARLLVFAFVLASSFGASAQEPGRYTVEIDLQEQKAYLLENRALVLATPISTGRAGHLTETGSFHVAEKERNHFSSMYGQIVDAQGNTTVTDADSDMPVPRGGKFVPAPMRYFMRFNGAIGMHAGYLPGYAASHGCVRMPEANAIAFFNAVEPGTPVTVFGTTPLGRSRGANDYSTQNNRQRGFQPVRRVDPRFGNGFPQPMWWR